ncbi:MAG: hypothetical protein IJI49_02220 [Bacilli bacterium]|nr:hypothetical protein [Bacilli bacterium]
MGKRIRKVYYYVEDDEEVKDNRRLFYLLIILAFTGIMLSTTTYAWFTTNRIVTIGNIDVKVQTEGSLEISADGQDWKALVDYNNIISVHDTSYRTSVNQLPTYIKPVSTVGGLDANGFMEMYLGIITDDKDANYNLTSTKETDKEENGDEGEGTYIAFDVFLRTTATKDLYLTNDSQIFYNGNSTGTENATRVAFVVEGNVPDGTNLGTIQGLFTTNTNNVYIWEPNYDTHTENGIENAREVYGITTTATGAEALSYDGIKTSFTEQIRIENAKSTLYPNYFGEVNPRIKTIKNNTAYQPLFTLESGITKVRIYMWLEGQDVDCENKASVGNLTLALQFSTNPS